MGAGTDWRGGREGSIPPSLNPRGDAGKRSAGVGGGGGAPPVAQVEKQGREGHLEETAGRRRRRRRRRAGGRGRNQRETPSAPHSRGHTANAWHLWAIRPVRRDGSVPRLKGHSRGAPGAQSQFKRPGWAVEGVCVCVGVSVFTPGRAQGVHSSRPGGRVCVQVMCTRLTERCGPYTTVGIVWEPSPARPKSAKPGSGGRAASPCRFSPLPVRPALPATTGSRPRRY